LHSIIKKTKYVYEIFFSQIKKIQKIMKTRNTILFCCIFLCACSIKKESDDSIGDIPCVNLTVDAENTNNLPVENIKNARFVKLETTEKCLIGEVNHIKVTENRIFILDRDKAKALFVFDFEGKFLFQVGSKGEGPGEYFSADDFFVDEAKQQIMIYNSRSLHYYDWRGVFVNKHSFTDLWPNACCPLGSGCYALDFTREENGRNKFYLSLLDQENNSYFNYKPLDADHDYTNKPNIAFYPGLNNKVFYTPTRCDTIFVISHSGIESGYAIDFGSRKLPANFDKDTPRLEQAVKLLRSQYCYGIKDVSETDKWLAFEYKYGMQGRNFIYNKETKESYSRTQPYPRPQTSYKNFFIGIYEASILEALDAFPEESAKCEKAFGSTNWAIFRSLDIDDNPLVVFYEIAP
jgi:hypothetical protein